MIWQRCWTPWRSSTPVSAMHTVSHDLTLQAELPLRDGGVTNAWIMQVRLRAAVYEMGALVYGTDTRGEPLWPDKPTTGIMALWGQALADVAAIRHADDDTRLNMQPEASRVEWLMKWQLLERLRRRHGLSWNDPKLRAIDLGWAALDRSARYSRRSGRAPSARSTTGSSPMPLAMRRRPRAHRCVPRS